MEYTQQEEIPTAPRHNFQAHVQELPPTSVNEISFHASLLRRISQLEDELKASFKNNGLLRSKLKKMIKEKSILMSNLSKYLADDQIETLKGKKNVEWGAKTVSKALYLRKKGRQIFNFVRKQLIPLPSLTTCKRRVKDIHFKPGVIEFNLIMLAEKCKHLSPVERNFAIGFDEVAIIPGNSLDPSTKKYVGNVTLPPSDTPANFSLVCIAMGLVKRIKMVIAYEFTDKSITGQVMIDFLFSLLMRVEEICKIKIKVLCFDLGTANRSMISKLGITLNATNEIYYTSHPSRPDEKLFLCPDGNHASKNINQGFKNHGAKISKEMRDDFNLSSLTAKAEEIEKIYKADNSLDFPLAPMLNNEVLHPTQFEKMDPKNATKFHSPEVTTAIQYKNQSKLAGKKSTTAFILENFHKLHAILTSTTPWTLSSEESIKKYESDVEYLRWFAGYFLKHLTMGSARLVSLHGIKMTIYTLIEVSQDLFKEGASHVIPSRLLTNAIENVFSVLRSLTPQPSAVQVSQSLRVMSISQFQFNPISGVYDWDESEESSIDFVSLVKSWKRDETEVDECFNGVIHLTTNTHWNQLFSTKIDFNSFVCFMSAILSKIIQKLSCSDCKDWITEENIDDVRCTDGYELLVMRHSVIESCKIIPSQCFIQLGLNLEFLNRLMSQIDSVQSSKYKKNFLLSSYHLDKLQNIHCEELIEIVAEPFISSRLKMLLHRRDKHRAVKFASKSIK